MPILHAGRMGIMGVTGLKQLVDWLSDSGADGTAKAVVEEGLMPIPTNAEPLLSNPAAGGCLLLDMRRLDRFYQKPVHLGSQHLLLLPQLP
ncbi:MAG: hypothetical protein WCO86_06160 [Planctomycetota bacterium]